MVLNDNKIKKYLLWLLVISTVIRAFLAAFFEFGNDEVYYWTYALYPDWSHFDHPPMVGWVMQLFSLNLLFSDEFFLRLASVVFMTIDTWLFYRIGKEIKDSLTGFYAALLFTASLYGFVITGVFILPDTPLMLFMLLSLLSFIRYFKTSKNKYMLLGGLFAGLSLLSKYSAVFIWSGVGLYILLFDRKQLKNKYLYLSALISVVCLLPVLIWNIQNDFISFTFHGDRVSFFDKLRPKYFLTELVGEFLYNNPVNFVMIIIALVLMARGKRVLNGRDVRILLTTCIPFIAVFWFFSLTRPILPHWTAPALSIMLLFPAAVFAEKHKNKQKRPVPVGIKLSLSLLLIIVAVGGAEIKTGFVSLRFTERSETVQRYGESDFTLSMYGWKKIRTQFESIRNQKIEQGMMKESDAMINLNWYPCANLDYYVAYPLGMKMLAYGEPVMIHKYLWINEYRGGFKKGDDYWFLTESCDYYDVNRYFKDCFSEMIPCDTITVERCGKPAKYVFVYMLKDLKKVPDVNTMIK